MRQRAVTLLRGLRAMCRALVSALLLTSAAAAQRTIHIDVTGADLRYADTLNATSFGVSPALELQSARASLRAAGTFSRLRSAGWSMQGAIGGGLYSPAAVGIGAAPLPAADGVMRIVIGVAAAARSPAPPRWIGIFAAIVVGIAAAAPAAARRVGIGAGVGIGDPAPAAAAAAADRIERVGIGVAGRGAAGEGEERASPDGAAAHSPEEGTPA